MVENKIARAFPPHHKTTITNENEFLPSFEREEILDGNDEEWIYDLTIDDIVKKNDLKVRPFTTDKLRSAIRPFKSYYSTSPDVEEIPQRMRNYITKKGFTELMVTHIDNAIKKFAKKLEKKCAKDLERITKIANDSDLAMGRDLKASDCHRGTTLLYDMDKDLLREIGAVTYNWKTGKTTELGKSYHCSTDFSKPSVKLMRLVHDKKDSLKTSAVSDKESCHERIKNASMAFLHADEIKQRNEEASRAMKEAKAEVEDFVEVISCPMSSQFNGKLYNINKLPSGLEFVEDMLGSRLVDVAGQALCSRHELSRRRNRWAETTYGGYREITDAQRLAELNRKLKEI